MKGDVGSVLWTDLLFYGALVVIVAAGVIGGPPTPTGTPAKPLTAEVVAPPPPVPDEFTSRQVTGMNGWLVRANKTGECWLMHSNSMVPVGVSKELCEGW